MQSNEIRPLGSRNKVDVERSGDLEKLSMLFVVTPCSSLLISYFILSFPSMIQVILSLNLHKKFLIIKIDYYKMLNNTICQA